MWAKIKLFVNVVLSLYLIQSRAFSAALGSSDMSFFALALAAAESLGFKLLLLVGAENRFTYLQDSLDH